jgi:hypothetical protein
MAFMPVSPPFTAKLVTPTVSTACILAPHVPSVFLPSFFMIKNALMHVPADILHQLVPIYAKTVNTPAKIANLLHLIAHLVSKDTSTTTPVLMIVIQAFMKITSISYVPHVTQNVLNAMECQHIAYRVKLVFTISSMDAI